MKPILYIILVVAIIGWALSAWKGCNTNKENQRLRDENDSLQVFKDSLLTNISVTNERIRVTEAENDSLEILLGNNSGKLIVIKKSFEKNYSTIHTATFGQLLDQFAAIGPERIHH